MKTIKLTILPFTLLATAALLGGCVGAEPGEGGETPEVQDELESAQTEAADLELKEALPEAPKNRAELDQEINDVLRTNGGERTAINEITWETGTSKVVLSFPVPEELNQQVGTPEVELLGSSWRYACPPGWYCFYQNANFNGLSSTATTGPGNSRLLKWSTAYCSTPIDFINHSFRDKTSSWYNNGSLTIYVRNWKVAPNYEQLWIEAPNSSSSWVGSYDNDKADFFKACP